MNNSGDAAEQVVRLSLEATEVVAKLTGSAAKETALLLMSALKSDKKDKTKGKERLTKMLRSGKELKVFSVPQKNLKTFMEQAKKYGVLYCVLKDKYNKDGNTPIDIIARAEDVSKIQRIFDRFELGEVDKGAIVTDVAKDMSERQEKANEVPEKSHGDIVVEQSMGDESGKENNIAEDPTQALAEKESPSRQSSEQTRRVNYKKSKSEEGRPSVREKLNRYKAQSQKKKEADRSTDLTGKSKPKAKSDTYKGQHFAPKKKKKYKKHNKAR